MNKTDGLSQEDRVKEISSLRYPSPLDSNLNTLMKRSVLIASYLKFFSVNYSGELVAEDYFDLVLNKALSKKKQNTHTAGDMEPSLALLLNFLENLEQTTAIFNNRWENIPNWYMLDYLGVKPLPLKGDKVWVSFKNSGEEPFTIPRQTGFKADCKENITKYYDLKEDVEVHNASIQKLYLLEFQKKRNEDQKGIPSLKAIQLRELSVRESQVYSEKYINTRTGIRITSPVLILREGIRKITIDCFPFAPKSMETINKEYLDSIFSISISTEKGWENIAEYNIEKSNEKLVIEFTLPDYFPSTSECTVERHSYLSSYPAINLHLNLDASDYQKSNIENFRISKVKIAVSVRKVTNVKVYNELGKVDNSKPFAPFGINTEKGAWFSIGNYEMNIKDTKNVYANFYWEQLPEHPMGLVYHYAEYERNIDNNSFELEVRYLSDYQWKKVSGRNNFFLFNSERDGYKLSNVTVIGPVDVEKMPVIKENEEEYDYSLNTRNGFLNFRLINPEIGFGEHLYRKIFTEQIMRNARKKQKYPSIQPPVQPVLKRVTIDYDAEDTIDTQSSLYLSGGQIQPIMPLEEFAVNHPFQNDLVRFVPQIEDYNLLIAISRIEQDMTLNVFFDVFPVESNDLDHKSVREQRELLRDIRVYIGNPVYWKKMPLSFVVKDETMALLISGCMKFQFPDVLEDELYDDLGLLWIRIAFEKVDTIHFPEIRSVYVNAGLLEMRMPEDKESLTVLNPELVEITEETLIPGLGEIIRISDFYGGILQETPEELFLRMGEYTSHKGRAVTARDYERLVLQAFPEIAKVKCLMGGEKTTGSNVCLIVLPKPQNISRENLLTPPHLLYFIEKYIRGLTSAYVDEIKVVNPMYEQVIIRCKFYRNSYLSLKRKKLIEHKINQCIAPWLFTNGLPVIGYTVDLKQMHNKLVSEFKEDITFSDFSAIYISKAGEDFNLKEFFYKKAGEQCKDYLITPLEFNSVLVPAEEHIILSDTDQLECFGVNEMIIGKSFIIPKN